MSRPNRNSQNANQSEKPAEKQAIEWDDPPENDLHDKQSAAVAADYRKNNLPAPSLGAPTPLTPDAQLGPAHDVGNPAAPPASAPAANPTLEARIAQLEAENATLKQAAKPKPSPVKFEIPESANLEPEVAAALNKFADAANEQLAAMREELEATRGNVGKLETEHALTREERALTKLLDHLPSDHFRAVFEGDDANDRYREVAVEVQQLREFDKSKGRKRSDAELFRAATINLFTERAEENRSKGGRPRGGKDRTMNRVSPAAPAPTEYGVSAAKQAAHGFLVGVGHATNGWNPNPEDTGF
jgi:hypothetical protein